MRLKAALLITFIAATALPAAAQGAMRSCGEARASNQIGGAVLGSVLGGIAGSNIAAGGHRHDGTAVGAVLGGLVGAGIGGSSTKCGYAPPSGPLPPPPGTYAPGYGYNNGPNYGSNGRYSDYPSDPGYSSGYGYEDDPYYRDRSPRYDDYDRDGVYASGNRDYRRHDDYAGRDCTDAIQTTRLPDGTVIRRPVEACRDAYYGDWQVDRH